MARIFLDKITKIFERKKNPVIAVRDVTLEIPEKSFVALLGPSGCGKTTTLRIIAGLERPTSGRVYFDDVDVTGWDAGKRNVAMVFQFPVLYPTLTVYENIALALQASKLSKQEIRRRVIESAEFMGIKECLEINVSKLDINLRQKVALARVLVRDPSVFILDEPLTVVEPKVRVELRAKLKEIQLTLGRPMIYVSHDQAEAMTLADKIAVMNEGRILQYDTPENLYNNPSNTFVGWFIGNPGMNFVECEVSRERDKTFLIAGEGFKYDASWLAEVYSNLQSYNKVIFGIRPEDIVVSSSGIRAKCFHLESVGNRLILHLEIKDKKLRAKVPATARVKIGEEVYIDFVKEKIKLFDPETGNAIV